MGRELGLVRTAQDKRRSGLANRRAFDDALHAEWRQGQRRGTPLALIMIDIDHFKAYNDRYGHQDGDVCLQAVAKALKTGCGRPHDLVARYGGEEFVCLLPECDLAAAQAKAEELCRSVAALGIPHDASATAPMVTISLGVAAAVPEENSSSVWLLATADAALYQAKSGGRNRVCVAPEEA